MRSAKTIFNEAVDLRFYVAVLIIVLATSIIGVILAIQGIHNFYYGILSEQSTQYALNYAQNIGKSAQAAEVINELLAAKLLTASKTVALLGDDVNNTVLANMAESLDVDEIYYYTRDGVIMSSNRGQYLGWTSYPGHPVEQFRVGSEPILVEDMRADTESGELYKYSYIKTERGFYHLGIRADRVHVLMEAFEPSNLIHDMAKSPHVDTISLLTNDLVVQFSSDPSLIGQTFDHIPALTNLQMGETFPIIKDTGAEKVYEVLVPITFDGVPMGILSITQPLTATENFIKRTTRLSIIAIAITYISLSYTLYTSYQKKKHLFHLAYHHSSSGLPNRRYLRNLIETNTNEDTALLLVHLRNFTTINHLYGFHFGDELFKKLAYRLQAIYSDLYHVSHFSGSRLAFYTPDSFTRPQLSQMADEIIEVTNKLIDEEGFLDQLDTQVAIVEIPDPNCDPERVFTNASLALMYQEEQPNINQSFYSNDMEERLLRADTIEQALRDHLENPSSDSLWVEYQPILDLKTNRIVAFEALTRMYLPDLGMVAPPEFISIAERKHLIAPLGIWVLSRACQFIKELTDASFGDIRISINVSGTGLLHEYFIASTRQTLREYGVSPQQIIFEITESVMSHSFSEVNTIFERIRNLGIQIAIDDFGTGYSSFARIEDFQVDIIKIDKFFVDKILSKEQEQLILGELVAMCRKLGLEVVAEGVEKEDQRQYLREQQCDMMQGFLFSRSLSVEHALAKIQEQNG